MFTYMTEMSVLQLFVHFVTRTIIDQFTYFPAHKTHRDFFVGNFRKKIMNVF